MKGFFVGIATCLVAGGLVFGAHYVAFSGSREAQQNLESTTRLAADMDQMARPSAYARRLQSN